MKTVPIPAAIVVQVEELHMRGIPGTVIARRMGISRASVSRIVWALDQRVYAFWKEKHKEDKPCFYVFNGCAHPQLCTRGCAVLLDRRDHHATD